MAQGNWQRDKVEVPKTTVVAAPKPKSKASSWIPTDLLKKAKERQKEKQLRDELLKQKKERGGKPLSEVPDEPRKSPTASEPEDGELSDHSKRKRQREHKEASRSHSRSISPPLKKPKLTPENEEKASASVSPPHPSADDAHLSSPEFMSPEFIPAKVPKSGGVEADLKLPAAADGPAAVDSDADANGPAPTDEAKARPDPGSPPKALVSPGARFNPLLSRCRSVNEYERLNTIDEGTYGVVHRARCRITGEVVALKKVKLLKSADGFPITSIREISLLLQLKHPNIIDVREVVVSKDMSGVYMVMDYMEHDMKGIMQIKKGAFSTSEVKCLMIQLLKAVEYMVMDYMEHDMKGIMQIKKGAFSTSEVKCLMIQLLKAVEYMHTNWVLHRDLKTSNILYSNNGVLKVCDFGMARKYGSPLKPYSHQVVTLWYRAPELLLGCEKYSIAVDMWSVGCVFAEFLTNKALFQGKAEMEQIELIFKMMGTPTEKTWPGLSKLKHTSRFKFKIHKGKLRQQFPSSSYMGSAHLSEAGFDLLRRLLSMDPKGRLSATDALAHPWFLESPKPQSAEMMPTFPSLNEMKRHKAIQKHKRPSKTQNGGFMVR
eukprot:619028_1